MNRKTKEIEKKRKTERKKGKEKNTVILFSLISSWNLSTEYRQNAQQDDVRGQPCAILRSLCRVKGMLSQKNHEEEEEEEEEEEGEKENLFRILGEGGIRGKRDGKEMNKRAKRSKKGEKKIGKGIE